MMLLLREALVMAPVGKSENSALPAILKLFQRAPFRSNYPTNVAFLLLRTLRVLHPPFGDTRIIYFLSPERTVLCFSVPYRAIFY